MNEYDFSSQAIERITESRVLWKMTLFSCVLSIILTVLSLPPTAICVPSVLQQTAMRFDFPSGSLITAFSVLQKCPSPGF